MSRRRISPQKRLHIAAGQEYRCAQCNELFDDGVFEIDHKIPLWQGGEDAFYNMHALCRKCHGEKTRLEGILREDIHKEEQTGKSRFWEPTSLQYLGKSMSFEEYMNGYKQADTRDFTAMHRRRAAHGFVESRRYLACLGELKMENGTFLPGSKECIKFIKTYNSLHPEDTSLMLTAPHPSHDESSPTPLHPVHAAPEVGDVRGHGDVYVPMERKSP